MWPGAFLAVQSSPGDRAGGWAVRPSGEVLALTQSQACRHPTRSPIGKCAALQALECKESLFRDSRVTQACGCPDPILLGQPRGFPSANFA